MKQIRTLFSVLVLAISLVGLFPQKAYACDCDIKSIAEQYAYSSMVFSGEVVSRTNSKATFKISEVFKGDPNSLIKVGIPNESTSCGLGLVEGSEWMIFVTAETGGNYATHACSGSFKFEAGSAQKNTIEEERYSELVALAGSSHRYVTTNESSNIYLVRGFGFLLLILTVVGFGAYALYKDYQARQPKHTLGKSSK